MGQYISQINSLERQNQELKERLMSAQSQGKTDVQTLQNKVDNLKKELEAVTIKAKEDYEK